MSGQGNRTTMTSRERVTAALEFRPPDVVPLSYAPIRRGLYDHGEKLRRLFASVPGDFMDFLDEPYQPPDPADFEADGGYHKFVTDEWGVEWEYRIFAMTGHPYRRPLDDLANLDAYKPPPCPWETAEAFAALKAEVEARKRADQFVQMGFFGIFEHLHSLRRFEDVLTDLLDDTPEINRMADMICDYNLRGIEALCKAGVDMVCFGDDYGTATAPLISPELFRYFFKPRLRRMAEVMKRHGKKLLFHSCGVVAPILPDLKEIGVDAIWPQLTAYAPGELARISREQELAVQLHIDRGAVMTAGTPDDVRAAVADAVKTFRPELGGSWLYIEIDHNFPYENIRAIVECAGKLRGQS